MKSAAEAARARIAPHVRMTPVERSAPLSALSGADVWLKLENYQVTGSFKARGALSKLCALREREGTRRKVITASSGNHGAAVSFGLQRLGMTGIVLVPENASPAKVEKIRGWGAEVRFFGQDSGLCETEARRLAERDGLSYVSPYNDAEVVAGQATIALELAEQLPQAPDAIFASVGGGGLIGGIAGISKALWPRARVVGASPVNSCDMVESVRQGRIVNVESSATLSDGTAGTIEADCLTFELCRRLVDEMHLVDEDAIKDAMRLIIGRHQMLVEGSAAVPLAALLKERSRYAGKTVVLVVCGANVGMETLREVLRD